MKLSTSFSLGTRLPFIKKTKILDFLYFEKSSKHGLLLTEPNSFTATEASPFLLLIPIPNTLQVHQNYVFTHQASFYSLCPHRKINGCRRRSTTRFLRPVREVRWEVCTGNSNACSRRAGNRLPFARFRSRLSGALILFHLNEMSIRKIHIV